MVFAGYSPEVMQHRGYREQPMLCGQGLMGMLIGMVSPFCCPVSFSVGQRELSGFFCGGVVGSSFHTQHTSS